MNLSWEPASEKSVLVAIARETKKPTNYKVVYLNPEGEGASGGQAAAGSADDYVSGLSHDPSAKRHKSDPSFGSTNITLPPNGNWVFEPLPMPPDMDKGQKREVWFVTGPSGSGKSYWIRSYVKNYIKMFPGNAVYLLSSMPTDETLDAVNEIKRLDIDKIVTTPPRDIKTFKNTLVIIDDAEAWDKDKIKSDAILALQDMIASQGRQHGTSLIRAAHRSTDYNRTRLLFQEINGIVIYPQERRAHSQYMRALTVYMGFGKKEAMALLRTSTRWLQIHHSYPEYILSSNMVWIPSVGSGV